MDKLEAKNLLLSHEDKLSLDTLKIAFFTLTIDDLTKHELDTIIEKISGERFSRSSAKKREYYEHIVNYIRTINRAQSFNKIK